MLASIIMCTYVIINTERQTDREREKERERLMEQLIFFNENISMMANSLFQVEHEKLVTCTTYPNQQEISCS